MSTLTITYGVVWSKLTGAVPEIHKHLEDNLFFYGMDPYLADNLGIYNPKIYCYKRHSGQFRTGLLSRVLELLKELGKKPVLVRDYEPDPTPTVDINFIKPILLRRCQERAVEACLKHKRGVLMLPTGCLSNHERVLMADFTEIAVKDLIIGDELMGPDGKPREVLEIHSGVAEMYKVIPKKGEPFVVSEDHVLPYWHTIKRESGLITIKDYQARSNSFKKRVQLTRSSAMSLPKVPLPIPPMLLGILIGDGALTGSQIKITSADPEIENYLLSWAKKNNCSITIRPKIGCKDYHIKDGGLCLRSVKALGLAVSACDKFIPPCYLKASLNQRRSLLAGLLSTDGSRDRAGSRYTTISRRLAEGVQKLCYSLGLSCNTYSEQSMTYRVVGEQRVNTPSGKTCYRSYIGGDFSKIPILCPAKKPRKKQVDRSPTRIGFKVEPIGKGPYVGFALSGDKLHLDRQFFIHHNSGKTISAIYLMSLFKKKAIFLVDSLIIRDQAAEAFENLTGITPGIIGDSVWYVQPVTFATLQTVGAENLAPEKIAELKQFESVWLDESHSARSDQVTTALDRLPNAAIRFGMSATPWRDTPDDLLIEANLGKTIYSQTLQETYDEGGILVKPEIHLMLVPKRQPISGSYAEQHKWHIQENPERNDLIVKLALKHKTDKVLVLCQRITQIDCLKQLLPDAVIITGKVKGKDREEALAKIHSPEPCVVLATSCLEKGFDAKTLNVLILADSIKSRVKVFQSIGRVLRWHEGKEKAVIYDLQDAVKPFKNHAVARLKLYKMEPFFAKELK